MTDSSSRHRLVIIGSGFGGLFAAKALKGKDVDVTLISATTSHLFQPLLYQVATGILSSGEIAPTTREILRRHRNVRTLLGEVTAIDLAAHTVTSTAYGEVETTPYDSLIVAAGAGQSYFGNDHFAEFAPGLKSIDDALELRGRIFSAFELAELTDDPAERERLLTFTVVGAGPTGVEMAGQILELSHRTLRGEFRSIDPTTSRVILLDAAPAVLGNFGDKLSGKAHDRLTDMGVEVRLGAKVVDVDADGLVVEDDSGRERIESRVKVWAAGVQASPLGRMLADQSEVSLDRAGRVQVRPDLTIPGHPEVMVVGDMMALDGLPGVAQVAIQSGRYAARSVLEHSAGREMAEPFHYTDKGSMATISRFGAIASVGPVKASGFVAWLLWLFIHLLYIAGFKNRITTLFHWFISFLGRGRAERTITERMIVGRGAIQALGEDFRPTLAGRPVAGGASVRDDTPAPGATD
ncbi:MAG: NAD(P)/FAD-dependent oxidoreductase [Micrococcales bacterium]|nr:NAD(P)/FAD-dependent oxidoreductase [Micrococcales bacterium]